LSTIAGLSAKILVALAAAPLLVGCGDFWQAPNGSTTTSGGTTASTTTLTASPTSVTVGESAALTATVSPSAATGTVTFSDGATSLGTAPLTSGTATLTPTFSTVGSQSLIAAYGGDSTYAASTSAAITLTVTAASGQTPTTISLRASSTSAATGENLTLTATVSPQSEVTGTVTFFDGAIRTSNSLGTATIRDGAATLPVLFPAAGTHNINAVYGGAGAYAMSSTLTTLSITVSP
jgi:hypothetical protein